MEIHPILEGYLNADTKVLVIGTFPPAKEYTDPDKDFFFYSSPYNHFWNRCNNIFAADKTYKPLKKTTKLNRNETFSENNKRKMDFVKTKRVGFIDIFSKISRTDFDSSRDEDIIPIETILQNDVFENIIKKHEIKRVCCVYKLAYNTFLSALESDEAYTFLTVQDDHTANKTKLIVNGHGKQFELVLLYAATRSPERG